MSPSDVRQHNQPVVAGVIYAFYNENSIVTHMLILQNSLSIVLRFGYDILSNNLVLSMTRRDYY